MVRVHFAEREPVTLDPNEIEFTAAGGVVLRYQELAEVTDPQDIRLKRRVPAGPPRLLGAWSRDAHWTQVEEIVSEDSKEAASERPALEVAR